MSAEQSKTVGAVADVSLSNRKVRERRVRRGACTETAGAVVALEAEQRVLVARIASLEKEIAELRDALARARSQSVRREES